MDRLLRYGPFICFGVLFMLFVGVWLIHDKVPKPQEDSKDICMQDLVDNTPKISPEYMDHPPDYTTGEFRFSQPVTPDQPPPPVRQLELVIQPSSPPIASETVKPQLPDKPSNRFVSRGERICKETMERIYGVPFVTVRPKWLNNPETGMNLELDCYNDELKIGVEYNGEQHYKWPNFTNQTYEQFNGQIRRDRLKYELCERYGVYLITVPYNVSHDKIPNFIISQLPETVQNRIREEKEICRGTGGIV